MVLLKPPPALNQDAVAPIPSGLPFLDPGLRSNPGICCFLLKQDLTSELKVATVSTLAKKHGDLHVERPHLHEVKKQPG